MRIPILTTQPINNPYGYVYLTTVLKTGKMYIGQHAKSEFDPTYVGSGIDISELKQSIGIEGFHVQIIDWATDKDDLDMKEIWWIGFFNAVDSENFYNRDTGGSGFKAGKNHPMNDPEKRKEFIQKISNSCKGRKLSKSTKEKISKAVSGKNNGFYGKHHTQQSIDKMKSNLPDYSGKNNPNYGNTWSEGQRKTQSEKVKKYLENNPNPFQDKQHNEESKQKMKKSWDYSKHFSEETKRKMSESHKGRTPANTRSVVQLTLSGEFIQEFQCVEQASVLGFQSQGIIPCCKGRKTQYKGYKWKYSSEYYKNKKEETT